MYELIKSSFGSHTRFTLRHPATGNAFSIVPARGANVLDLTFGGRNILDGYSTPEDLEAAKWGKSALLFPFPNRLNRGQYHWQGKSHTFPINNESTGNAIHGFVRGESFEVSYVFLAQDHASILCNYTYAGDRPYYPFPFSLEVEFMIHDKGVFTLEAACLNLHDAPIPVGFGWHPYFRLSGKADEHSMRLPSCRQIGIDERMIPTGKRFEYEGFQKSALIGRTFLDNCFCVSQNSGSYQLALEAGDCRISVKATARQFPFFQVFTPPHRDSVALEPMSCNVDAFNNSQGLVSLAPGKEWKAKMEVVFDPAG